MVGKDDDWSLVGGERVGKELGKEGQLRHRSLQVRTENKSGLAPPGSR